MLLFLPVVGLLLGLGTVVLFALFSHLHWFGALFAAAFYMMMYGFLHTEAVIDVFDALYASHTGKDPYTIVKEPTVGAVGVLYGVMFLLLKVAGIIVLLTHHFFVEFISILIISRLTLLMLIVIYDFRSSFLKELKIALNRWHLSLLFITTGVSSFYFFSHFFILLIMGLIIGYFVSVFFALKLDFVNGDILGVTLESIEILLFLGVALFMVPVN
jgi:adenosylcobinamide-GDP ribazoletransferase